MAVGRLGRLAARAPAPVLAVAGAGGDAVINALLADASVEVVASPRHATVLVVAGGLPRSLLQPLAQVHDQLPSPRATVWVTSTPPPADPLLPDALVVAAEADVVAVVRSVHAELMTGERPSEQGLLATHNPVEWQGVGPHGQGGDQMMGGTPYGRAMAMTDDDVRDGLALDRLELPLGPVLPGLPTGLTLDMVLQGDVVQSVAVRPDPFTDGEVVGGAGVAPGVDAERSIAAVELGRVRHHLGWLARTLWLDGLPALARRSARVAQGLDDIRTTTRQLVAGDVAEVRRLLRALERLSVGATAGVGRIMARDLGGLSGPVARASGVAADARADDAAYRRLGFEVVIQHDGDTRARLRQRFAEIAQALDLASRAGAARLESDRLEGPHGSTGFGHERIARLLDLLPSLLVGMELGDAVITVNSLDLDLAAAAAEAPFATVAP